MSYLDLHITIRKIKIMTTLNTIITRKTGAGHYEVCVMKDHVELGTFETTNMQLIDDIDEMNVYGFEEKLEMHETFEEVIETCINKL